MSNGGGGRSVPVATVKGWDKDNHRWVNVLVTSDGKLQIASVDDAVIGQDTPENLKHVPHGYDAGTPQYRPYAVDPLGRLQLAIATLESLADIGDVNLAGLVANVGIYWDAVAGEWRPRTFLPTAGGTMTGLINMGGNKITTLPAGTVAGDAIRYDEFHAHIIDLDAHIYSFMQKLRVGEYFRPEPTQGLGQQTLFADRIYARPLIVPRNLTIDRLAIQVITADAGKIARLGIYEDGTNLYPGALVKDYGTISVAATGVVAASGDQALTKGLYWLVIVSDGTPKIYAYRPSYPILGQKSTGFYVGTQQNDSWYKNAVGTGPLADPFVSGARIWQQYAIAILPRLKSLD